MKDFQDDFAAADPTKDLKGFGCEKLTLAIGAAGCLLGYAKETQRTALPHLRSLKHERLDDTVVLDGASRRMLERYL